MTCEVYKSAIRDLKDAFEAYTGIPAFKPRFVERTEGEFVAALARQLAFARHVSGGQSRLDGMTGRDVVMRLIADRLLVVMYKRVDVLDAKVRDHVIEMAKSLPPPPTIGPMRVHKRNAKKDAKARRTRDRQSGTAPCSADQLRARIEHRLAVEAREADEAIVERLVQKRRKEMMLRTKAEAACNHGDSLSSRLPGPSHRPSCKTKTIPPRRDAAGAAKRETEKHASLRRMAESARQAREREAVNHAREEARALALQIATAIQNGEC
jgi:hypothetical protein